MDKIARHLRDRVWPVVKRWNGGEDRRACIRRKLHISQVNAVEGSLANAEDERAPLLEDDVGSAVDEVRC